MLTDDPLGVIHDIVGHLLSVAQVDLLQHILGFRFSDAHDIQTRHPGALGEVNVQPNAVVADLLGGDHGVGKEALAPEFLQHGGHLVDSIDLDLLLLQLLVGPLTTGAVGDEVLHRLGEVCVDDETVGVMRSRVGPDAHRAAALE